MKKLVYIVALAFAASMVACGGSDKAKDAAAEAAEAPKVVEAAEVVEAADSLVNDSTAVVEAAEAVAAEATPAN